MRTLTLVLVLSAVLAACSNDNPVDNDHPQDSTKADQLATAGFQSLGDTLRTLQNLDSDQLRDFRFDTIRNKLEKALTYESNNAIAHLGLAIVEILELNYSSDIWEVADSLDAWGGSVGDILPVWPLTPGAGQNMLIGRQFELMAQLPAATTMRMAMTFPSNVSVARIQDIITHTVQPALNRSIGHLNTVERQRDAGLRLHIKDNGVEEDVVIDLGEILVFSAAVHALRAGFRSATAYDVDLWGPGGNYDWLDDIRDLNRYDNYCSWLPTVKVTDAGDGLIDLHFTRDVHRDAALVDSIWTDVIHYNLEDRTAFLSLRDDGASLTGAHADLVGVLDRLEDAAAFIRSRPHETEENVIKLTDLTDIDSRLGDPDGPNFAKNWTKIEDVIVFVRSLLDGPVTFQEELGPNDTPFMWTMNLGVLYKAPIDDWSSLLPYHEWDVPAGAWLTSVDSLAIYPHFGGEHCDFVRDSFGGCDYQCWSWVARAYHTTRWWDTDTESFLHFLDGPNGDVIDLDVARFPYFPDYSFHGLFPGMGRGKWLELIDILDPPPGAYLAQVRGVRR